MEPYQICDLYPDMSKLPTQMFLEVYISDANQTNSVETFTSELLGPSSLCSQWRDSYSQNEIHMTFYGSFKIRWIEQ